MISTPDRQNAIALIDQANAAGARRAQACAELGIDERTCRRWRAMGGTPEERRLTALRPAPHNKLSEEERQAVLDACNSQAFESLPPSQIVPRLADQGRHLASEASFYRILRADGQQHHRGRAKPPARRRPPASHRARGPCEVWSWDITWMPGPIRGGFFYLYLILDIYSRKIVGWEVHQREGAELAAELVRKAVWAEGCFTRPLVLHADNGSPMKGATMKATLERLGVIASYSRPRVSDGRVGDWRGSARLGGVAVVRRLSPYAGASFPAVRPVSSHRSSNRTCRFPASGFLPARQTFALDRSTHRLGTPLKPGVDRHASGL